MQNTVRSIDFTDINARPKATSYETQRLRAYERILAENNLPLDPVDLQNVLAVFKEYFYKPKTAAELFDAYLYTLKTDVRSNSHDTYERAYNSFLSVENTFNEESVRHFIISEQEKGNQNSTINTKLSALRACSCWAFTKGYIPKNFMELIRQLPVNEKLRDKVIIDVDKVFEDIDSICRKPWIAARNKAMFMIFMSTGCRVSEFINIEIDNISKEDGRIKLEVTKGGKQRLAYYPDECTPFIEEYIRLRNEQTEIDSPYLFISAKPSKDGSYQLTRQGAFDIVTRHTNNAGNKNGCHALRHWCADKYREEGADIRTTQEALGHKLISTTATYYSNDEDKKKEAANKTMSGVFRPNMNNK